MLLLMAPTSKQWLLFKPRLHVSMQDSPLLHKPQIKHSKNKQSFCTNLNYFSQCWMQIVLLQQANNDCYSRHNSMWACNTALCSLNPRSDIRKTNRVFAQTEWFFTMWNANSAAHGTNKQVMIVIQATSQCGHARQPSVAWNPDQTFKEQTRVFAQIWMILLNVECE